MNELTDGQIDAIPFPKIEYCDGHVIRTHRRAFARAVIAADRELQDVELTNAPTDGQIDEALKVLACTVIGADRKLQDARHLEELRAYELTCGNLRAEVARLTAACDKWSEAEMLGRGVPAGWALVPKSPTTEMVQSGGHVNSEWLNDRAPIGETRYCHPMAGAYQAMLAAAPQPPAQPERQPMTDDLVDKVVRSKQPHLSVDSIAFGHIFNECKYWLEALYEIEEKP